VGSPDGGDDDGVRVGGRDPFVSLPTMTGVTSRRGVAKRQPG